MEIRRARSIISIVLPATLFISTAGGDPPVRALGTLPAQKTPRPPRRHVSAAAGFDWLARHQAPEGNWSADDYLKSCKDDSCRGSAELKADTAVTAAALLCFMASGQTHKRKGPYKKNVFQGFYVFLQGQKDDGSMATGMDSLLADHSLATLALCENYGLSRDPSLGGPAQIALRFIEKAPLPEADQWKYRPGLVGDSTAIVWQMLALSSGKINGLIVDHTKLVARVDWLREKALAADESDVAAAAAGLLATQALGMPSEAPDPKRFVSRLLAAPPARGKPRDCVAWLLAAKALSTIGGETWQEWHSKLEQALIDDQIRAGCAVGSWAPHGPAPDAWGQAGGRVFVTALTTLLIEFDDSKLPSFKGRAKHEKPARKEGF